MLNEYMFFSSKGGASKTTFARLTAEYLNQINQIM
jgi:cellulose biosynthesis protein BcsQ